MRMGNRAASTAAKKTISSICIKHDPFLYEEVIRLNAKAFAELYNTDEIIAVPKKNRRVGRERNNFFRRSMPPPERRHKADMMNHRRAILVCRRGGRAFFLFSPPYILFAVLTYRGSEFCWAFEFVDFFSSVFAMSRAFLGIPLRFSP